MKELTVFNNDVIPVYTTDTGEKIVIGRELHQSLRIKTEYKDWFPRMCDYGFCEGEDYSSFLSDRSDGLPGKQKTDHHVKLDMAKHICMIQRTPEGKAIRNKLIALETNVSELSPQLQLLINMEIKQKELERQIATNRAAITDIKEIVIARDADWRRWLNAMFNKAVENSPDRDFAAMRNETYEALERRAHCRLNIQLNNMKKRLYEQGMAKSKVEKTTRVDVIEADPRLKEIYTAIVKELSIRYVS